MLLHYIDVKILNQLNISVRHRQVPGAGIITSVCCHCKHSLCTATHSWSITSPNANKSQVLSYQRTKHKDLII